jgi:phage terminase large subunit-like protein
MATKAKPKPTKLMGALYPRLHSPFLKGTSRIKEVEELAEKIGLPLMPWQRLILKDMLTTRNKKFVRKTNLLLVSRQSGKSHLARMRMLAGLFLFDEMNILMMSSNRSMALLSFREMVSIIERNDFLMEQVKFIRWTNGMEAIELKSGARLEIAADTRDSARGRSVSLLFIDELREFSVEGYKAAVPTTRARENSQILLVSNAGDAFSEVLNDMRERALSYPPESFGFYEYSAEPLAKISDRKAWAAANPALGYTITEEALEEAVATSTVETIRTEMLTQWIDSLVSPWPYDWFETTKDENVKLEAGGGVTVFAFDISPTRRNASLVAGQIQGDRIAVGILQMWHSPTALNELTMAVDIKAYADKYRPFKIFYDRYATQTVAERLQNSGCLVEDISGQAFYQACGDLLESISNFRIVHSGQVDLQKQMSNVAAKTSDAGWRIIRRQSAGDISAPIGLAMVVSKLMKPVSVPKIFAV